MSTREVHLELLLGRRVRDSEGKPVGRLEEVRADRVDQECLVREFHVGPHALLERLSVGLARTFGGPRHAATVIPWDKLDLSDPEHPRLTCRASEL